MANSPDPTMNPYTKLPPSAFWRTGVAQENPYLIRDIYKKKFNIEASTAIATGGSCFAQHISRYLLQNGFNVIDVEPPPPGLPKELCQHFGFSTYSARYGNIYTIRQLTQLAQEAAGEWSPHNYIWKKDGKFFDALRPTVEPDGFDSSDEVIEHRKHHISRVKELFDRLDLLIFTLGLTETWEDKLSGTVYPTAPGTVIGDFDANLYQFKNQHFEEIIHDFNSFHQAMAKIRSDRPFNLLLTVSPVPLTASASGDHVLASSVYSKSTLRSAAGQLAANHSHVDYFPSYEIVTNPKAISQSFADNLRSVNDHAVKNVMAHFFSEHKPCTDTLITTSEAIPPKRERMISDDIQCEDALLEAFGQ